MKYVIFVVIAVCSSSSLTGKSRFVQKGGAIQRAIESSQNGDTIFVNSGTYLESINFLGKQIVLKSIYGASATVIDAGGDSSVAIFGSGEDFRTVLDGFTLRNGKSRSNNFGGGISCINSSPTIRNCVISNNESPNGGGIYIFGASSPLIENNVISFNKSTSQVGGGGAIRVRNDSILASPLFRIANARILNNVISNNTAAYNAGGIDFSGDLASGMVSNCTIDSNTALFGGGIHLDTDAYPVLDSLMIFNNEALQNGAGIGVGTFCHPIIKNCIIYGNTCSGKGGGVQCFKSFPRIERCLIYNNQAGLGGGVYNWTDSRATIIHCTIAKNRADTGGGFGVDKTAQPILLNAIVWHNIASIDSSIGGLPDTVLSSNVQGGFQGAFNLNIDPKFVSMPQNNFNLLPESPCIDKGLQQIVLNGDTVLTAQSFFGLAPDMGFSESALLSSIQAASLSQKKNFYLSQNYPNPFNPTTTIAYQLSSAGEVRLEVFNLLGRKVTTLVNERQESGRYRVQLSSGNYQLSSGVYFYRLQAGSFSETRKMILMK